jgi:hypothetical protein
MIVEEYVDGLLIRSQGLQFDADISNCLKELEAAGIEVKESGFNDGVYRVTGNAGMVFELFNDSGNCPRIRIPGQYNENIADFRHLVLNVYHYQWRTQPVHADPPWRALFLRFELAREQDGVLISVV